MLEPKFAITNVSTTTKLKFIIIIIVPNLAQLSQEVQYISLKITEQIAIQRDSTNKKIFSFLWDSGGWEM